MGGVQLSVTDPSPDLVARLRAAGCVYAEEEATLLQEAPVADEEREALILRRVAGEPIEQLLGWAAFAGLRLVVAPGVFVPRRRTELLARRAAEELTGVLARGGSGASAPVLVDLCGGVGAVAAVAADAVPGAALHVADIDPAAVDCARRNLGARAEYWVGDLFAALPATLRGRIDVVAVNAPYVPTEAIALMPPEARDFELLTALDGGGDGLDLHRRIAQEAGSWLASQGLLLIETSQEQAERTASLLRSAGFDVGIEQDDEVYGTIAVGRRGQQ